jgi:hypothetical protein
MVRVSGKIGNFAFFVALWQDIQHAWQKEERYGEQEG